MHLSTEADFILAQWTTDQIKTHQNKGLRAGLQKLLYFAVFPYTFHARSFESALHQQVLVGAPPRSADFIRRSLSSQDLGYPVFKSQTYSCSKVPFITAHDSLLWSDHQSDRYIPRNGHWWFSFLARQLSPRITRYRLSLHASSALPGASLIGCRRFRQPLTFLNRICSLNCLASI